MFGLALLFSIALVLIILIGALGIVLRIVRPRRKTYAIALAQGLHTSPADLELDAEEARFNLPDGHTTPGWIINGQSANGPAVLILHGHGDCTFGALRFAQQLAPYASHLVVFDWPAHGTCTAPWMTCGKREPDDAIAVLEGLPDEIRNKPTVLFGYSLGGQIAIKTAGLHPDRFAGVIADGPYRHWDSPIRKRMGHHGVPALFFLPLVGLFFHLTGLIRNFDRAPYAKQINAPLLILHGSDDRVCPIEEGQQLAEAAPNATFVPIAGGQHNRLFDQDQQAYHAALDQFFKSITESAKLQSHTDNV